MKWQEFNITFRKRTTYYIRVQWESRRQHYDFTLYCDSSLRYGCTFERYEKYDKARDFNAIPIEVRISLLLNGNIPHISPGFSGFSIEFRSVLVLYFTKYFHLLLQVLGIPTQSIYVDTIAEKEAAYFLRFRILKIIKKELL